MVECEDSDNRHLPDDDFDIIPELNLIKSKPELKEILQDCLREKMFYNFVIPELEIIIFGNFDLSLPIYMKPSNNYQKLIEPLFYFIWKKNQIKKSQI